MSSSEPKPQVPNPISIRDLEPMLHGLDEGIVAVRDGSIEWVNEALARLYGAAPGDLTGCRVQDVFTDPDGRPLNALEVEATARLRDKGGTLHAVSVRRVSDALYIVIDRTREERLESEVWRLNERRVGEAEGANPEPLLADEVTGMIEHEIRTATTVIRGYLRLLVEEQAGPVTDEQRTFLGETQRETERITSLVDDLLDVASSESGRGLRVTRKPARLHEVIQHALGSARPILEERDLAVSLDLALEDDRLSIDPDRIEQVLLNLLSNSAKFSPHGSTIRVATHLVETEEGASVTISVLDEGPGVAYEDAERIFEPYIRGSQAEPPSEGVGLGLALCRRVVDAHGGVIQTIPATGYGLFRLSLPVEG